MAIAKKPFERHTPDEEYIKADIVNVRLNREERRMLEALKLCYNTDSDSTALKNEAFRVLKQKQFFEDLRPK